MNRCPSGDFCPVCEAHSLALARARAVPPLELPRAHRLGMWALVRSWLRRRPAALPRARQVPR